MTLGILNKGIIRGLSNYAFIQYAQGHKPKVTNNKKQITKNKISLCRSNTQGGNHELNDIIILKVYFLKSAFRWNKLYLFKMMASCYL